MDIRGAAEISGAESNEQQRRWNEKVWNYKEKNPHFNYDPTRAHLNFEIVEGGVIQPVDRSESIQQKIDRKLQERGIKNPNAKKNIKRRQLTAVQIIFGGSRERMHEMAFGKEGIDLTKGADNSKVQRNEEFDRWAKDVYDFACRKFGEKNIVSFYAHLDETNPHIHCTVLPVNEEKNQVSFRDFMGKNRWEIQQKFRQLHDDFSNEVNSKYGLERGSSKEETGSKHRSTEEYRRDLINECDSLEDKVKLLKNQIRRATIGVKGLTTMIVNREADKNEIKKKLDETERLYSTGAISEDDYQNAVTELQQKIDELQKEIDDKQSKLNTLKDTIETRQAEIDELTQNYQKLNGIVRKQAQDYLNFNKVMQKEKEPYYKGLLGQILAEKYQGEIDNILHDMSDQWKDELEDNNSFLIEMQERKENIQNVALLLIEGYMKEAVTAAEDSGGGGGGHSDLPWRDPKDDDLDWMRKCVDCAVKLTRPAGRSRNRRSGLRR